MTEATPANRGLRAAERLEALVLSRWGWTAVTLALTSLCLAAVVMAVEDVPTAVEEQEKAGLKPPALWAAGTMAVQVIGGAAIVSGRAVWVGAGLLGGLAMGAQVLTRRFWELEKDERRTSIAHAFFEHLGMIGGLLMTGIASNHRRKSRALRSRAGEPS